MPFTPTHIIAVVPIFAFYRRFSLVALSIGAIIPDFPMFFPLSTYAFSHSTYGIFLYCVPVGLVVYLLFESIGKQFLIDLLPSFFRSRLIMYRNAPIQFHFKNILMLLLAIIIGSFTHVVWDAFTHDWGWGVALIPELKNTLTIYSLEVPFYKIFQHGSTLIGLPLLLLILFLMLIRSPQANTLTNHQFSKPVLSMAIFSFLVIPIALTSYYLQVHNLSLEVIGLVVIKSISISIVLYFFYCFFYWAHSKLSSNG